jgi:hypothetical protein
MTAGSEGSETPRMTEDVDAPPFRYCLDGLFLVAAAAYLVNKFVFKAISSGGFCHSYANDLLCIPFTLPPILGLFRRLGVRRHDLPPSSGEILGAVVGYSLVWEWWLPSLPIQSRYLYADPWDVVCYAAGGLAAGLWWRTGRDRS